MPSIRECMLMITLGGFPLAVPPKPDIRTPHTLHTTATELFWAGPPGFPSTDKSQSAQTSIHVSDLHIVKKNFSILSLFCYPLLVHFMLLKILKEFQSVMPCISLHCYKSSIFSKAPRMITPHWGLLKPPSSYDSTPARSAKTDLRTWIQVEGTGRRTQDLATQ